jgi:hypothetical protein
LHGVIEADHPVPRFDRDHGRARPGDFRGDRASGTKKCLAAQTPSFII